MCSRWQQLRSNINRNNRVSLPHQSMWLCSQRWHLQVLLVILYLLVSLLRLAALLVLLAVVFVRLLSAILYLLVSVVLPPLRYTCRPFPFRYLLRLALRLLRRSALLAWWMLLFLAVVVFLFVAVALLVLLNLDPLRYWHRHHNRSCFTHRIVKMSWSLLLSLVVH